MQAEPKRKKKKKTTRRYYSIIYSWMRRSSIHPNRAIACMRVYDRETTNKYTLMHSHTLTQTLYTHTQARTQHTHTHTHKVQPESHSKIFLKNYKNWRKKNRKSNEMNFEKEKKNEFFFAKFYLPVICSRSNRNFHWWSVLPRRLFFSVVSSCNFKKNFRYNAVYIKKSYREKEKERIASSCPVFRCIAVSYIRFYYTIMPKLSRCFELWVIEVFFLYSRLRNAKKNRIVWMR